MLSQDFTLNGTTWVNNPADNKARVFDGMDVVQERNYSNQVTAQLVRDGNIGGILSRTTADGAAFYGYDGNGNVTLLTSTAGQDVGHYRYDAFGNTLEAEGPRAGENPYRFSTKELHGPSGLVDFGYRFYSPGMGRWLNRDPIAESGGTNLYEFARNNPINLVDFYGLDVYARIQGNKVTLILPIEFNPVKGQKADASYKKMVRDYSANIEKLWTGTFGRYQVTMKVQSKPYKFTKNLGTQTMTRNILNRVWLSTKPGRSSVTPGMLGMNQAVWANDSRWKTPGHEAGHLMGLGDRYKDEDIGGGKVVPIADNGWEGNIMGNVRSGVVEERNITSILNENRHNTDSCPQGTFGGCGF